MRPALAAALALSIGGCGDQPEDLTFPHNFQFGTAIAGFQVDMGCPTIAPDRCNDPNSDWYVWVTKPELVNDPANQLSGDPPSTMPGFYELFAGDMDRAKNELRSSTLRLSIEWSRLFPTSTVGVDGYDALKQKAAPDALAYYHALFAALAQRGLRPLVTLNHYTLPTWIHDPYGCHLNLATCSPRGWMDSDRTIAEIAKYAGFCAREFGGEVDLWATENEPFLAVAVAGYFADLGNRSVPPRVSLNGDAVRTVTRAMIEAHARMYDAVKANDTVDADGDGKPARVGIVYNLQAAAPSRPDSALDQQAARNVRYLMNEFYLNAVIKGDLDTMLDGTTVHRDDLAGRMDFLGINYYARVVVQGLKDSLFPSFTPLLTFNPLTVQTDYDYPRGIYEVLTFAKSYGVPLFITETGHEDAEDMGAGAAWIVDTLTWVKRALREGAPVEGYYFWTLMDNYEWSHGMNVRMGIYGVDKTDATKARHPRAKMVSAYSRIAEGFQIPADLLAQYPAK